MPEILPKLLHIAILKGCANLLESEPTPFAWTGHQFRPALHRIQLWTCGFVSMPHFYSETNKWLKYWAKLWVLLGLVTGFVIEKFILHDKKLCYQGFVTVQILQTIKILLTRELCQNWRVLALFPQSSRLLPLPAHSNCNCCWLGISQCLWLSMVQNFKLNFFLRSVEFFLSSVEDADFEARSELCPTFIPLDVLYD